MKQITMRDFLRTPKSFLPPPIEGIEITRRDGESFFIYPNVRQDTGNVRQMSDNTPTIPIKKPMAIIDNGGLPKEVPIEELEPLEPGTVFDFCKGHWEAVKGKKYVLRKITYEDENANPIVNKQWLCEKCIAKWEERGVGRVYYL